VSQDPGVHLIPLGQIPDVAPGDSIAELLLASLRETGLALVDGDVIVVAHKIVSKAEGRIISLHDVEPSLRASALADRLEADSRLVEVILRESRRVIRAENGVLITETHHGFKCAHAGVDRSNAGPPEADTVVLLPLDPDSSARRVRDELKVTTQCEIAVIINDSHGRPWRMGTVGLALGSCGVAPLKDLRGQTDMYGRELVSSRIALIDEIAAAASLVMSGADERVPAVLVRGLSYPRSLQGAASILRPRDRDLFP
jgi:coenzyme F420-0:L-glutamate ligase/coenzyme F420-1:gamma-L-glutamate ligase